MVKKSSTINEQNLAVNVNELYTCVQGEGKYAGVPHILIRMSGCPLRCFFDKSPCDTYYSSWFPEKGKFSLKDIEIFYKNHPNHHYTMISGGSPTANPQVLAKLIEIAKKYNHFVTIETEGSAFVQTEADFISLSPKLSNSVPVTGKLVSFGPGRERVIIGSIDVERHEKGRKNYEAMIKLISSHKDYQLKVVVSNFERDFPEIKALQKKLKVPNHKVYLMPEGTSEEQLKLNRQKLIEFCAEKGEYNYTDRLQVIVYGNKRGV
mgnify:CR=1 FL=1